MVVVIGPALLRRRPAAVPVGRRNADRERLVLDREQELVELTAHATRKGPISQLVNRRFEALERPIDRGFWMLAHRSIDQGTKFRARRFCTELHAMAYPCVPS